MRPIRALTLVLLTASLAPTTSRGIQDPPAAPAPPVPPAPPAQEEEEEPLLGRSSASNFGTQEEPAPTIELRHGSRLRLAPDPLSPLLELVAEDDTVAVLERHEGWVRVRYGIWKGWILEDGRDTGPLVSGAPPDRREDLVRLERAREIMGARARETTLGPYVLVTDLRENQVDPRLAPLVASLAESYRQRFGLDPGPPRGEAIVIFAHERDYRQFESEDLRLAGLDTEGYTAEALLSEVDSEEQVIATLTATFLGDRESEFHREILVHELTHMLNRRAVGPHLPPWLEEGLAEDLALSQVDASGRLVLGSWGGGADVRHYSWSNRASEINLTVTGSRAALQAVLFAWRTPYRPELELLSQLSWEMLVSPSSRSLLYAQSAFLTRYLLDGAGDEGADRFRAYLADVAGGEAVSGALWSRLDSTPREIEEDFYLWLRRKAVAYGARLPN